MTSETEDDGVLRGLATAAAHQASEATTELLRFAREGQDISGPFGEIEVVEKLLDAAKMAIECLREEGDRYFDIYDALRRELEFWAG